MNFNRNFFIRFILVTCIGLQLTACATNFRQGLQNLEDHNYPAALAFFEADAKLGYRIPAIQASQLYIFDYQIPRDLEKSRHYLDIALKADYGRYDQVYDYYIPLIKAYQLLADTTKPDKSLAFKLLNYEKYKEYSWPLKTLAHCNLVGYGTELNIEKAIGYFEKAVENQIFKGSNVFYAWWLAVYPDDSFRNAERALSFVLEVIDDKDFKDKPLYLDTLAAVYAANGQFEKAQKTQQKALKVLNENIQKYSYMSLYKATFDSRLEYYNQGKPWVFSFEDIKRCGYNSKRCMKKPLSAMENEHKLIPKVL